MPPVLLLDTNSIFFRAYHALPPMCTSGGQPTSALYGFSVLLLKLLREEEPKGIAFARDAKAATFRHAAFEDYKAQRAPVADALASQFPWLDRLLEALAVPVFTAPGFEADDVLATLTRELHAEGETLRIVTGDRDLFQVTADRVDVLFVGRRAQKPVVYDAAAVEERFGVPPHRLPSWMALVGDPSDNLEGVPGIGPRTATKLLAEHADVTALLADLPKVHPPSLRAALASAAERVRRNERLARLDAFVPLAPGARFALPSAAALERVRALFRDLEFKSLLARLPSS